MKKLFFTLLITVLVSTISFAQNGERRGGNGGGNQMREMMKEKLKSELKISDENADSVASIQVNYQREVRATQRNADMDEAKKTEKIAQLSAERSTKLKAIINEDQIKKLDEMMENMRKMREQRQGDGQRFPGNN